MKLVLLVNPAATAVTAENGQQIESSLADAHEVEVVGTRRRGHATELARAAAQRRADAVVVLGGDGTVSEAANGLARSSTALGVLPGGSTNVFARTIGLPNRVIPAAERLLAALDAGSRRRIGMGVANGRYFLFHVGIGFDAAVVERVESRGQLKRRVGQALFVCATVAAWSRHYDRSRPRFSVHFPDGVTVEDGYFAICLKTDPYTFLGPRPLTVAPGTGFDTGLALVVLRDLGLTALLGAGVAALTASGRLGQLPHVTLRRDLDHVEVRGHGPFPHQVDGDYMGEIDTLTLSHERDLLDLVVPVRSD